MVETKLVPNKKKVLKNLAWSSQSVPSINDDYDYDYMRHGYPTQTPLKRRMFRKSCQNSASIKKKEKTGRVQVSSLIFCDVNKRVDKLLTSTLEPRITQFTSLIRSAG